MFDFDYSDLNQDLVEIEKKGFYSYAQKDYKIVDLLVPNPDLFYYLNPYFLNIIINNNYYSYFI